MRLYRFNDGSQWARRPNGVWEPAPIDPDMNDEVVYVRKNPPGIRDADGESILSGRGDRGGTRSSKNSQ